jgi:hypothetical protein
MARGLPSVTQDIEKIFGQYIQAEEALGFLQNRKTGILPGWEGDLNILLDVLPTGQNPRGEVLIRAFNKLKHRFTITEQLDEFGTGSPGNSPSSAQIEFATDGFAWK